MPSLKRISQDENWEVRKVIAEGLPIVCESFEDPVSRGIVLEIVKLINKSRY